MKRLGQEVAALDGLGPGSPDAGEVVKDLPGAVEVRGGALYENSEVVRFGLRVVRS